VVGSGPDTRFAPEEAVACEGALDWRGVALSQREAPDGRGASELFSITHTEMGEGKGCATVRTARKREKIAAGWSERHVAGGGVGLGGSVVVTFALKFRRIARDGGEECRGRWD
jgi:hypothetical protein